MAGTLTSSDHTMTRRRTRTDGMLSLPLGSDVIRELHDSESGHIRQPAIVGDQHRTAAARRRGELQSVGRAQHAVQRQHLVLIRGGMLASDLVVAERALAGRVP